jgi:calcium-dependent protein kinase
MASQATAEKILPDMYGSSLAQLIQAFARMKKTAILPDGMFDSWIVAVKKANKEFPLSRWHASMLEQALISLGMEHAWIKPASMLSKWTQIAKGIKVAEYADEKTREKFTDKELREVFDSIDTDKSGTLDVEELKSAFKTIGQDAADETIEKMFAIGDTDGDNSISFDEFKVIMLSDIETISEDEAIEVPKYTVEQLREVFGKIDTDGSGDLDVEELKIAIRTVRPGTDDETIAKIIASADADGNTRISFDEFTAMLEGS